MQSSVIAGGFRRKNQTHSWNQTHLWRLSSTTCKNAATNSRTPEAKSPLLPHQPETFRRMGNDISSETGELIGQLAEVAAQRTGKALLLRDLINFGHSAYKDVFGRDRDPGLVNVERKLNDGGVNMEELLCEILDELKGTVNTAQNRGISFGMKTEYLWNSMGKKYPFLLNGNQGLLAG